MGGSQRTGCCSGRRGRAIARPVQRAPWPVHRMRRARRLLLRRAGSPPVRGRRRYRRRSATLFSISSDSVSMSTVARAVRRLSASRARPPGSGELQRPPHTLTTPRTDLFLRGDHLHLRPEEVLQVGCATARCANDDKKLPAGLLVSSSGGIHSSLRAATTTSGSERRRCTTAEPAES